MELEGMKELLQRIFKKEGLKRVFSKARFFFFLVGSGIASVFSLTSENVLATMAFACICYIIFRYGQIKGYLP